MFEERRPRDSLGDEGARDSINFFKIIFDSIYTLRVYIHRDESFAAIWRSPFAAVGGVAFTP